MFTVHLGTVPTVVVADITILKELLARFVIVTNSPNHYRLDLSFTFLLVTSFTCCMILISSSRFLSLKTLCTLCGEINNMILLQKGGGWKGSTLSDSWHHAGTYIHNRRRYIYYDAVCVFLSVCNEK